jgi:hypothetical protein
MFTTRPESFPNGVEVGVRSFVDFLLLFLLESGLKLMLLALKLVLILGPVLVWVLLLVLMLMFALL